MQFANRPVLEEAEHFLDHLEAGGGTNTHDALRAALQEPDVEVIYLLSDGEPTSGITDPSSIINDVKQFNALRSTPVQIHTVAFLMGHEYDDPTPRRLMGAIAAATGGVFRCLDPFAPEHEEHGDFLDDNSSFSDDADFQRFYANRLAALPPNVFDLCNKLSLLANMPPPPNWKGNLINRQRTNTEVVVPKVEQNKDHGHHIYDVQIVLQNVVPDKPITWTLSKTFNDFKHLHDKVKNLIDTTSVHLPPDPLFHHHNAEFLENRRVLLQTYIQNLYISLGPFANPDVNEILMYDTNVDEAIAEATDIYQAHYIAGLNASGNAPGFPPQGFPLAPQGFPLNGAPSAGYSQNLPLPGFGPNIPPPSGLAAGYAAPPPMSPEYLNGPQAAPNQGYSNVPPTNQGARNFQN